MKQYLTFLAVATVFAANADTIPVTTAYFSGPYPIPAPFAVDSVDVNNKLYSPASILDTPVNRQNLKQARVAELSALPNFLRAVIRLRRKHTGRLFCHFTR